MLTAEYQVARSISYVIHFISFVIAYYSIGFIQAQLASRFSGLILVLVSLGVAWALMMFVLPRIVLMFMR